MTDYLSGDERRQIVQLLRDALDEAEAGERVSGHTKLRSVVKADADRAEPQPEVENGIT